jgi:hypothetical protein
VASAEAGYLGETILGHDLVGRSLPGLLRDHDDEVIKRPGGTNSLSTFILLVGEVVGSTLSIGVPLDHCFNMRSGIIEGGIIDGTWEAGMVELSHGVEEK